MGKEMMVEEKEREGRGEGRKSRPDYQGGVSTSFGVRTSVPEKWINRTTGPPT